MENVTGQLLPEQESLNYTAKEAQAIIDARRAQSVRVDSLSQLGRTQSHQLDSQDRCSDSNSAGLPLDQGR